MTNSAITLGCLLKRIDNYDNMNTFAGRLRLQKTIYLMQAFDLYIGYNFSWYIRGPYSADLTKDGFELRTIYDAIPNGKFHDDKDERRFTQFLKFLGDKKNDADWLEIVASIHFLKKVYPNLTKEQIITRVKNKQPYFTQSMCQNAWHHLKQWVML